MRVLLNDNDRFACAWLRQLVTDGHLEGDVDERPIQQLEPADLADCRQVHLFAGIGGWPLALKWAGWPSDRPVWTGSCPCQPFSAAGKRRGTDDERHLWPEMLRLIKACRPGVIFGEQVPDERWVDGVEADLRGEGFRFWAEVWDARVFGCPQPRRRTYWVAHLGSKGVEGLGARVRTGEPGPWGWGGEADLRRVCDAPFERGDRWPQPMLRAVADGVPARMERLRGAGNAIVPQVAAAFIRAFLEAEGE